MEKNNEGIWVKYNKDSDSTQFFKSLKVKVPTLYCDNAKVLLRVEDFYAYYTKDSNGEYTDLRILMRVDDGNIIEILGMGIAQNLEPEMLDVVKEKIEEFPNKDRYLKKVADMEMLNKLYNEYKDRELTLDELSFLFEANRKIDGFGYSEDPRIDEIICGIEKRDLAKNYGFSLDEVGKNSSDLFGDKKISCIMGNVGLCVDNYNDDILDKIRLLKYVDGYFLITTKNPDHIVFPENVRGNISVTLTAEKVKDLEVPEKLGEEDYLILECEDAENIKFKQCELGRIIMDNIKRLKNVVFPEEVGNIKFGSLEEIDNLVFPQYVSHIDIDLSSIKVLKNVVFPDDFSEMTVEEEWRNRYITFEYNYNFKKLEIAENVTFPCVIDNGCLELPKLKVAKNVTLPSKVKSLILGELESVDGLIVPEGFECEHLESKYISLDDLLEKSLESNSVDTIGKQKGFSNLFILATIVTIVCIGIIVLGVFLNI